MPTSPMRAAAYLRVSTDEQKERQSIATQREFARSYCDLHTIEVAHYYEDDGVSGTIPLEERPAGNELLRAARSGQVSTVLIYKVDRLGRDPRGILNAVATLESLGVQVRSMTEPFDTAT